MLPIGLVEPEARAVLRADGDLEPAGASDTVHPGGT